ncbi:unnamed protein product [Ambrosiozyma monospora]|uniref:Unnamed protein product n=1 Tax=Ambrosiozyma monospora TaxID=43982 RepID=A0ACB5T0V4_AMBMO|nr:unnamed protein product [Ambrosiozyma monospora]
MQVISSTSFSTPAGPAYSLSPASPKKVTSASDVTCFSVDDKTEAYLNSQSDDNSDIGSITSTDSTDEFHACSTAEASLFFSKLVEECGSTLVSVSGSGKFFEVIIDSICENDLGNEPEFQGICCPASPPVSFYTESDEPPTSCSST